MSKWLDRFLNMADLVASWSKDPSTKVGAVITDDNSRVVGVGFNGFPRGCSDSEGLYAVKEVKYPRTIHAEVNAVLNSNKSVEDCSIIVTAPPCMACAAVIIQSGIKAVYCRPASDDLKSRWGDQFDTMKGFLAEANVHYEEI